MSYSALPPALLDLTLLRLANAPPTRLSTSVGGTIRWQRPLPWRRTYQKSVTNASSGYANYEGRMHIGKSQRGKSGMTQGPLAVREGGSNASRLPMHPLEELERKVQALDETIETQDDTARPFFYAEEELMAIYEDVLAFPIPEVTESNNELALEVIKQAEEREDQRILAALQHRILEDIPSDSASTKHQNMPIYRRILARAHEIFSRVEAARNAVNPEGSSNYVPLALLSIREFETLVRESMKASDPRAAAVVLDMMKREKVSLPPLAITNFLQIYAASGDMKAADELLANFLTDPPTEKQRHLHIKAHLNGTPEEVIPTSALEILHQYEEQNLVAPMQTYTTVISSLFSRPSSLARAQAWDIFTHMRYAAHPDPDAVLYTLMIRACASPVSIRFSSEPEKALDLWTEMTVDHKLTPTVGTYNAVILACARSGTKTYVNEAFRLARQMLDSHRDARGLSAFRPNRKTFCALLEGAKRIGDLGRARWILAEMVRETWGDDPNAVETEINDEVMMHVFNAYAAYKPPFVREATIIVEGDSKTEPVTPSQKRSSASADNNSNAIEDSVQTTEESSSSGDSSSTNIVGDDENTNPSFSHLPPQSRGEVIREVRILFNRILHDRSASEPPAAATASLPFSQKKFRGVEMTSHLLGAYLSVFYKHASLETCAELLWKIADHFGEEMSPRIYVEALERCGNARRGHERQIAVPFADKLWEKWVAVERAARLDSRPISARYVERAHIAMIRALAIAENTNRAMSHLRSFAEKYPPNSVRTPAPKPAFRSTRSALVGNRPLVRMTSAAEVPDDYVPPLITFRDVEILHHRLIDDARTKDIGYVTWLCKAYEWALRVRRDEAIKAKVAMTDTQVAVSDS